VWAELEERERREDLDALSSQLDEVYEEAVRPLRGGAMKPGLRLRTLTVAMSALLVPTVVGAQEDVGRHGGGDGRRFVIPEHDLYPESIAYDAVSGDYFLGSMGQSRILRLAPDGTYRDFVRGPAPALESSVGLKVDAARRRLWVCTGRYVLYGGEAPGPARTGVLLFDLDTGSLTDEWLVPQPSPGEIFNDLAVAEDGSVYVTTTLMGRVYRLSAEAHDMELVFASDGLQTNGITFDDTGDHLFFSLDRGIARLDRATGEVVSLEGGAEAEAGTDGLYFVSGALVSVQPRRRRVVRLALDDARRSVTRVDTLVADHPDFAYPTTGVLVGDTLVLVATSFADHPKSPGTGRQHGDVIILGLRLPGA
jgi:sugar lactone lactonase YvrE